jgi:hydrogenase 3 maturation protease
MSNLFWPRSLQAMLARLRKPDRPLRVAVLGIGHELNGDDAVGIHVAQMLQPVAPGSDRLLVVNAGPAPENFTGPLRRFRPDLIIMVDAAQMNEAPGTIRLLDWRDTQGLSASSHTLPPYVFADYAVREFDCAVALLGIQPEDTSLGAPLSARVHAAAHEVERELGAILSRL